MIDLFGEIIFELPKKGKVCKKCGKYKSYKFFYKSSSSKDGHRSRCKLCEKIQHHEYHSRPHKIAEEKYCVCCGRIKKANEFAKDKTQKDGLHSHCKECQSEARKNNNTIKMINKPKSRKRLIV